MRRIYQISSFLLRSRACPVKLFKKYLTKFQISPDSRDLIFTDVSKGKDSCKLIAPDKDISYGTMRETFRRDLKTVGADPSKFGLHSLRLSNATTGAYRGVSDTFAGSRCKRKT